MSKGIAELGTKAVAFYNEYNTDKANAKMAELLAAAFAMNSAYKLLIEGNKFAGVTNGFASAGLYRARVGFQHRTFDEENATYHAHNLELKKTNKDLQQTNEDLQETKKQLSAIAEDVGNLTKEERKQLGEKVTEYQEALAECRKLIGERHQKLQELDGRLEDSNKKLEDSNKKLEDSNKKLEETSKRIDEKVALLTSTLMESALVIDTISKQIVSKLKSVGSANTDVPAIQKSIESLTEVIRDIGDQLKTESQK